MTRRLLNLLMALSLLLCVATAVLWVRSYDYHESLAWPWSSTRRAYVLSPRGGLTYFHIPTSRPDQNQNGFRSVRIAPQDRGAPFPGSRFLGFRVSDGGPTPYCSVPYWFILSATALPPGRWLVRTRTAARRRCLGRCPGCGYDLRATPGRRDCCVFCCASSPVAFRKSAFRWTDLAQCFNS